MWVMKYEGECVKTMEWFESCKTTWSQNKQMHLNFCYRWCSIELIKKWVRVMKYEGECIKNTEWSEYYEDCFKLKQKNSLTSLLPMVVDWIEKQ